MMLADDKIIVTAQHQPQPQQQNNHNCSLVETKYKVSAGNTTHHHPPHAPQTQKYMIEQK